MTAKSSLADFAKLVELFDQNGVSFVSVTQQCERHDDTNRMGRPGQGFCPLGSDARRKRRRGGQLH
jgi:DNA invertase Pin-like site-specific DNA recombinase